MKDIVIIGARIDGHAGVVVSAVLALGKYRLAGFIDNTPELQGTNIGNVSVLGSSDDLGNLNLTGKSVHIAIGDNSARYELYKKLKTLNIEVETIIHPSAIVDGNVTIGEGSFVAPGAIINSNAEIGKVVIINTGAIIEHDNKLANAVHMAPGTTTAGRVDVNELAFVGVGSTILPDITVGTGAMIGAGSTIVKDVEPQMTVIGYAAQKYKKKNIYTSTETPEDGK
ncbi:MAG TPA: acetyltransferase [Flavobacteriales bacterium]|nr:acetyltransferase [Flavobacteriales bacterium]